MIWKPTDTATTIADFMGVPQISKVKKQSTSTVSVKVQTTITYDPMYRIQTVSQTYNGGASVKLANYNYNELGQVYEKNLGFVSGTTYLQNVNMRFNIRRQLLYINNSKLANDTGKTSNDTNDLFGMQMLYDKADANLGNTAYYNGKLSAVKWMSKDGSNNSSYERAFRYYYDSMNRDTAAIYAERTTAGTGAFTTTHGWDENRITYDQGGNILTLFRNSTTQGSGGHTPIDNLTYTYSTSNPNQLTSVADATGNNAGFYGGTGTYAYDGNGNLTNEPYKGIAVISYDVLNRTDKMTFTSSANRYITYTYDAGGNLVRKQQYDNVGGVATLQNTTDYLDGFVYTTVTGTQTLSYFAAPEGRVLYSGTTFTNEYIITDQQGNARISFNNTGTGGTAKVVQENSYYAFGLIMPGSAVGILSTDNKHLYNGGSEWQNDYSNLPDYYQTFNRNYDAAIGRFIGVDPVAESAESMTSYQYAGNNPIMFNDPLGDVMHQLPMPGSHDAPIYQNYTSQFLPNGGPLDGDWQDSADNGGAPPAFDDGTGLYNSNPDAYWGLYNATGGTFAGTGVYHAGNVAAGDPSTGSLAVAEAVINSVGTTSGVNIYVGNDGVVTGMQQNTPGLSLSTQNSDNSWNWGPIANQGGADDQQKNTPFMDVFQNVLKNAKIGVPVTPNDLMKTYGLSSKGASIIKSLTKTSSRSIQVKWNNGFNMWLARKAGDIVFNDGTENFYPIGGSWMMWGNAIGVKYNDQVYYKDIFLHGTFIDIPRVSTTYQFYLPQ